MKKSAGILIYRKKNGKVQVFLVHPGGPFWKNKDLNSWSIPKGEITMTDAERNNLPGFSPDIIPEYKPDISENSPGLRPDKLPGFKPDVSGNNPGNKSGKYLGKSLSNKSGDHPGKSSGKHLGKTLSNISGRHPGKLLDYKSGSHPGKITESPRESALLNTALRELEEETGIVLTDEDKEKIFYLGEVKSKNKIVYVFALEKDLGDDIKIKSNLVIRKLNRFNADYVEKYRESKLTRAKSENKFIEFPEIDKGEYFDLEVAKEKLVSYQKELIEIIKSV